MKSKKIYWFLSLIIIIISMIAEYGYADFIVWQHSLSDHIWWAMILLLILMIGFAILSVVAMKASEEDPNDKLKRRIGDINLGDDISADFE